MGGGALGRENGASPLQGQGLGALPRSGGGFGLGAAMGGGALALSRTSAARPLPAQLAVLGSGQGFPFLWRLGAEGLGH